MSHAPDNSQNSRHSSEHADQHAAPPGISGVNDTPDTGVHAPPSLLPTVLQRLGLDGEQQRPVFTGDPVAALQHPAWHVRAAAVRSLEKMGEYAPLEPLLAALEDEHPSVRAAAVYALSKLGTHAPAARLAQTLGDPDWHVRETAVLALTALEQEGQSPALALQAQDADAAVRETARLARLEQESLRHAHHHSFVPSLLRYSWRLLARSQGAYMHKNDLDTREFEQTLRSGGTGKQAKRQSGWSRASRSLAISAAIVFVLANIVAWSIIAGRAHPVPTLIGNGGGTPPPVTTPTPAPVHTSAGKTVYVFHSQFDGFYSLAWSPDGKRIASASSSVQIWDATSGNHLFTYNPNSGGASVLAVAWSPDGKRIASASTTTQVWNPNTGHLYVYYPQTILQGNTSASSNISTSAANSTGLATILNPENQQNTLSGGNMIYALAWSPDGKYIASALNGNAYGYNVQIWNATTGQHVLTYGPLYTNPNNPNYITSVAWSPDGKYIASGGGDKHVYVWEAATGHLVTTYKGHNSAISSIAWSPDGKYIASGSLDGTTQVWNPLTGKTLLTYTQGAYVNALAWSHDGTRIASAGTDVQIWNASTGKHIYTYTGHGQKPGLYIRTVAWSPNDKLIVSGTNTETGGDTVRVWQA